MEPSFETTFAIYAIPISCTVMAMATMILGHALGDPTLQWALVGLWVTLTCWGSAGVALATGWFLHKKPFGWFSHVTHRSEAPGAYLFNVVAMVTGPAWIGGLVWLIQALD